MEPEALATLCQDEAWRLREEPPTGVDRLAQTLHYLREAAAALSDAARDVEAHLAEAMGKSKEMKVEGLGTLERKFSPIKPRWNEEVLSKRLAAMSSDERMIDEATGELLETDAEAAIRVFRECAYISYFRRGQLQGRGLDPNEFCDNDGFRVSVRIHPEVEK